jgi:hypothetical protein
VNFFLLAAEKSADNITGPEAAVYIACIILFGFMMWLFSK